MEDLVNPKIRLTRCRHDTTINTRQMQHPEFISREDAKLKEIKKTYEVREKTVLFAGKGCNAQAIFLPHQDVDLGGDFESAG